jgi:hypothetical protein
MPLYQYVVTCDGCDFRREPWAASAEEAVWQCGVDSKTAKCPECSGQLTATTSATPLSTFDELKEKLNRSWEPADDK